MKELLKKKKKKESLSVKDSNKVFLDEMLPVTCFKILQKETWNMIGFELIRVDTKWWV